ncbi:MAG TPA: UDP-3-O-(3-hydroxymyristoyl)glucosamine N-acyltransferase [Acidobacteriaceae bacterium]|jgi:UDP-3-O-[3-hydroxymyristoyl] glucosamine N-acyltransferase|nr:UDP-3-O-(3-hydroxymyristoyl)glucosamine N-acyltransferase [Acidobacteriaceae bacterium]
MQLGDLAEQLGATLVPAPGRDAATAAALEITGVAGLEKAGPHDLSFLTNLRYTPLARSTHAGALLVEPSAPELPLPTLRLPNAYLAFARALEHFHPPRRFAPGVHPTAVVSPSARIGARTHIGPYVVVGDDVRLGDDAVLLAHVVLYPGAAIGHRFFAHAHAIVREDCRLGDDVTLQNGAVIGADGFGFAKDPHGRWSKIPQTGLTVLEDAVEVQANACIDRASVGETSIGRGAKIDNLVQVGHGSTVGENTLLCAQVGLAGSTTVGKNVILAGQVGVAGHLTVGDGAVATAQTGIPSDVAPGAIVSGYPAMDNKAWLRTVAAVNRLPDLLRRLRSAEKS